MWSTPTSNKTLFFVEMGFVFSVPKVHYKNEVKRELFACGRINFLKSLSEKA